MSLGAPVAAVRTPEELYDLLDPDVMWYSADVDSNCTCNGADDAIACIQRNVVGLRGRFEVLGEAGDAVVVHPSYDPPRQATEMCLLLRFRDDLIVEMRDFTRPGRRSATREWRELRAVDALAHICRASLQTCDIFADSLDGIGAGGGYPNRRKRPWPNWTGLTTAGTGLTARTRCDA